jgi:hypothetical protein
MAFFDDLAPQWHGKWLEHRRNVKLADIGMGGET